MTLCPPRPLNFHTGRLNWWQRSVLIPHRGARLGGWRPVQGHVARVLRACRRCADRGWPPHSRSPTGRTLRLRRVRAHCCRETRASPVLRLPGSDRTPRVEKDTPGATGSCALGSRCVCGVERKIRPSFSFPSSTLIFYLDLTTNSQLFYLIAHLR